MKFEEIRPGRGYRGEVQMYGLKDDGRQVITVAHPEPSSGELKLQKVLLSD